MIRKDVLLACGGILLVAVLSWIVWLMLPGVQLERRFDQFIAAASNRNWKKVSALMADDYRDAWANGREQAVRDASEVLRHFVVLQITAEDPQFDRQDRQATVTARLHFDGRGTPIGESIKDYVNNLQQDFQFAWERKSWKPWDWKLVTINQPEIDSLEMP